MYSNQDYNDNNNNDIEGDKKYKSIIKKDTNNQGPSLSAVKKDSL